MKSCLFRILLSLTLSSLLLTAQAPTDKMRERDRYSDPTDAPLSVPGSVLEIIKLKGTLTKVDLKKRTVTIDPDKEKLSELELGFPQPPGREQIKVGKKAEKHLGKKRLKLEELEAGWKVNLQYYPMLGQVMELLLEKPPS